MHRLIIINIDEYVLTLQDEEENNYKKVIDFINTDYKPKLGDYITLPDNVLKQDNLFVYGDVYDKDKDDIILVKREDKNIYLQRYYG
ncbi:MAG: hypothetical protein Q4E69_04900 [Bacilli bacterium]|nr:hypothetical protein [Bacilli bacterium]